MHELAMSRSIVALVDERAAGRQVLRVRLEVGRLSGLMPDALRFCFDLCARGTAVEGAALEIVDIDGLGHCRACGAEHRLDVPLGRCPSCRAPSLAVIAGEELKIREMEVA